VLDAHREPPAPVPAPVRSAARLAWVARTRLLDTLREEAFDRFARLAATTLGEVTAFVTIVDHRRSFWKSCITSTGSTPDARENTVEESFCQYVIGRDEPLIVSDARIDPITRDNPSVALMGVVAWAGWPVRSPDGHVLGTFCVVGSQPRHWTAADLQTVETLASAVAGEVALRLAADEARTASRLAAEQAHHAEQLAAVLQESLLPQLLPAAPGLDIAAAYRPAGRGVEVLGDFYDAFPVPGGWGIVVGDVCGKGARAARTTALTRSAVRAIGHDGRDPSDALTVLDQVLADWTAGPEPVAVCYCTVQRRGPDARVRLSVAGHPPAVLLHPDRGIEELGEPGTMLGCGLPLTLTTSDAVLRPGAALVICTDGVTEARAPDGELFDEENLHALLRDLPHHVDADGIVAAVVRGVEEFTGGPLHDDVAVLVVRNPAAG
jgi:sigma-B regulation protein RsbU (phosphoserine phosphatase)